MIFKDNNKQRIEISPYAIPGLRWADYDTLGAVKKRMITAKRIMEIVCQYCAVQESMLRGKTRLRKFVWPRHIYCYLARKYTVESLNGIACLIGNRNHATIMSSIEVIKDAEKISGKTLDPLWKLTQEVEQKLKQKI